MALDTADKRASVFDLPGLQMNPFPSGSTSAIHRAHMSDQYGGVLADVPPTKTPVKWTIELRVSNDANPWKSESLGTVDVWVSEQGAISPWVKEKNVLVD